MTGIQQFNQAVRCNSISTRSWWTSPSQDLTGRPVSESGSRSCSTARSSVRRLFGTRIGVAAVHRSELGGSCPWRKPPIWRSYFGPAHLPAPLRIIEERTRGCIAGSGFDRARARCLPGIIGLIFVVLHHDLILPGFRPSGRFIALSRVRGAGARRASRRSDANLTLPGIAGLILSIGMAVDANVLIFERIREELAARRAPRTAVDEGFGQRDFRHRGRQHHHADHRPDPLPVRHRPVRGFAVTLCIGIVASFFSALYVTRSLFMMYLSRKRGSDPISI